MTDKMLDEYCGVKHILSVINKYLSCKMCSQYCHSLYTEYT